MKLGTAHRGGRDRAIVDPEGPVVPGYVAVQKLGGDVGRGVEVWRAEGPGGPAALRVVRINADATPEGVRSLERLRRARHPNVLSAFGSWRIEGAFVLATDLPESSLWDRLREARGDGEQGIPLDELLDQIAEAARGVDYLNGNATGPGDEGRTESRPGVPLGEVSPRTIVFAGGGVKVADADAVRFVGDPAPIPSGRRSDGGAPLWGLEYAAPEQFLGTGSRHSDQYGLAVTYCHLRTGRLPFDQPRADADADADGAAEPRRPVLSDLPVVERRAVARALADDPSRRWPSCRAFVDALRADVSAARLEPSEPNADPVTGFDPRRFARRRPPAARTLTATVGAAAIVGSAFLSGQPITPDRNRDAPTTVPTVHVVPISNDFGPRNVNEPDIPRASPSPSPPSATALPLIRPVVTPERDAAARTADLSNPPAEPVAASGLSAPSAEALARPSDAPAGVEGAKSVEPTIRVEAPDTVAVEVGRTVSVPLALSTDGVRGTVAVRFDGLPSGVSASPVDFDGGARPPTQVEVRADSKSSEGESVARLIVSAGSARAERSVRVRVAAGPALSARRRGDALLRREDYAGASASYTEAIALGPDDPLAFHGRALAAYAKGDFDPALADIDAALRLAPESPTALNNRGLIRLARGEHAAAVADFDTAIRHDPGYAVVRYNRGRAYSETAANAKAVADFDETIRLDPKFAKAFKARADVLARAGDRDRALADYDEALKLRPDDPATLNNRGLLLFARGEHHRAIADFDEAIRISPRYAVVRYNRGRVYAYLGDSAEALASFEQAIKLDPTLTRAVQARAELLNKPAAVPRPLIESTGPDRHRPRDGRPGNADPVATIRRESACPCFRRVRETHHLRPRTRNWCVSRTLRKQGHGMEKRRGYGKPR